MKHGMRLSLFALAASAPAFAYIEALYPLQQLIGESEVVAEGKVEKVDPEKKVAVVKIEKSIKGKCAYEKVRVQLGLGQEWHPEAAMKHLVTGAPVVAFYNAERKGMLYVNRLFLQVKGEPDAAPENAWWTFGHIEIRCNRTYCGTAESLIKHLRDVQAGKSKPQPVDAKIPAITKEAVTALPVWGTPNVDEASLPAPFKRSGP
jgi:hypothetical protein